MFEIQKHAMIKRQEKLNTPKGRVDPRCGNFSSWGTGDVLFDRAAGFRSLILVLALIAVGQLGLFAQTADVSQPDTSLASLQGTIKVAGQEGQADTVPDVLVTLSG